MKKIWMGCLATLAFPILLQADSMGGMDMATPETMTPTATVSLSSTAQAPTRIKKRHKHQSGVKEVAQSLSSSAQSESMLSAKAPSVETHTSTGVITGFEANNQVVVINHKAFPDGFMGAMEMSFELQDPKLASGFKAGDQVTFTLQKIQDDYEIVAMEKVAQ